MRLALLLLVALLAAGCAALNDADPPPPSTAEVRLAPLLDGLDMPVLLVDNPATRGEAFVLEQGGRVWRVGEDGGRSLFLDLREATRARGEQGLLGMAFAPTAGEDGRQALYVSYTDLAGDSVLERRHVRDGRVEPGAETLLAVDQPYANHNGGHLAFGPDGYLYYGLGDGGGANDPQGNGQDPHALLGSLLRLDVSPAQGYAIPPGNPYADGRQGAPEVYAKGLRNPWRFSFDRETGDLWIADVGQNAVEEVNLVPAGTGAGANFGWDVHEGTRKRLPLASTFSPHTPPVAEYGHDEGCSVTGGFAYRGDAIPALRGAYVFSDYCGGALWTLRQGEEGAWRRETLLKTDLRVSSFGEDEAGELHVVDHGGAVLRLAPAQA